MQQYDVIVIGGGPGGLAAAYPLASAGKKVLVVERDLWGGTCPNYGCDPKKMLYSAVQAKTYAARMTKAGLNGIPDINWPKLMAFKRAYTRTVPSGTRSGVTGAGMVAVDGEARFIDEHTIAVGEDLYEGQDIIIATGVQPVLPDIKGRELIATSRDFLDMDHLPQHIAFIGAGYVSMELANIAAAAGAEVDVIMHGDRALRGFPAAAVDALQKAMQNEHIHFHENIELKRVDETPQGTLRLQADGFTLDVQRVFAAMGRRPDEQLHLNRAHVKTTARGIVVNEFLETTTPHIYAIGDVAATSQPKLTPVAGFDGRYVAEHLLGSAAPIAYPAIPTTVYGSLEISKVGVSPETAAGDDRYVVNSEDVTHWYTYNRTQETFASVTVVEEKATNLIVGATVVSSSAESLVNLLTMAINTKTPADQVQRMVFAYPSEASDMDYLL
ncbi:dihydrolipoyl dehydrogenase family protein [Lacticaseibacillus hegangensis]|uniref:Dihydrolipoyl dehydrogenase family protein n=1 Tax=Lacticaseibacillus hegangensis TaxID=2486010 RepID=A0ABW4CVD1_9LACO|nr:NAD(P)/FAD-dependent oxidoreductase [Lacticaseibacillus hegangensis]